MTTPTYAVASQAAGKAVVQVPLTPIQQGLQTAGQVAAGALSVAKPVADAVGLARAVKAILDAPSPIRKTMVRALASQLGLRAAREVTQDLENIVLGAAHPVVRSVVPEPVRDALRVATNTAKGIIGPAVLASRLFPGVGEVVAPILGKAMPVLGAVAPGFSSPLEIVSKLTAEEPPKLTILPKVAKAVEDVLGPVAKLKLDPDTFKPAEAPPAKPLEPFTPFTPVATEPPPRIVVPEGRPPVAKVPDWVWALPEALQAEFLLGPAPAPAPAAPLPVAPPVPAAPVVSPVAPSVSTYALQPAALGTAAPTGATLAAPLAVVPALEAPRLPARAPVPAPVTPAGVAAAAPAETVPLPGASDLAGIVAVSLGILVSLGVIR